MKVEVAVLGSPSLISPTVSVDVEQHFNNNNNNKLKPAVIKETPDRNLSIFLLKSSFHLSFNEKTVR